jgi:hypothetical protein
MPEWHDPRSLDADGLWDPVCDRESYGERLICEPILEALQPVRHVDELHHRIFSRLDQRKVSSRAKRTAGMMARPVAAE